MPGQFRLMTTNLLHDKVDAAHFAHVLEAQDPDLVVTQELGPTAADVLVGAYPHHRLRPALDYTGRGIATRLGARFGDIDMPGRAGTAAVVTVGDREVRVAGVHLLNPVNFPWWVSARGRSRQLDELFGWLEGGDGPVIVAGDLNASPMWPAYKRVAEVLSDVVAEAASDDSDPEPTWGWRPGWPRMLRIDHIFGDGISATGVEVIPIHGSDHAAIVADIQVE